MKTLRRFSRNRFFSHARITAAVILISAAAAMTFVATSPAASGLVSSKIALSGTSSPRTGDSTPSGDTDVTKAEFPGQIDEPDGSPGPVPGFPVNRSLSKGVGKGVAVQSGKKAKSNPQLNSSFAGLNHYQQRYARSGNQF